MLIYNISYFIIVTSFNVWDAESKHSRIYFYVEWALGTYVSPFSFFILYRVVHIDVLDLFDGMHLIYVSYTQACQYAKLGFVRRMLSLM